MMSNQAKLKNYPFKVTTEELFMMYKQKAPKRNRTADLFITSESLYRLSHGSIFNNYNNFWENCKGEVMQYIRRQKVRVAILSLIVLALTIQPSYSYSEFTDITNHWAKIILKQQ